MGKNLILVVLVVLSVLGGCATSVQHSQRPHHHDVLEPSKAILYIDLDETGVYTLPVLPLVPEYMGKVDIRVHADDRFVRSCEYIGQTAEQHLNEGATQRLMIFYGHYKGTTRYQLTLGDFTTELKVIVK